MVVSPLICIAEDNESIALLMSYHLEKSGYSTFIIDDGKDVIPAIKKRKPHLLLLDWMLPSMSGPEICLQIKSDAAIQHTPIIMVSAKDSVDNKTIGLNYGCDDYIAKPFSIIEVIARVNAILRRTINTFQNKVLSFGDIEMDLASCIAKRDGKPMKLSFVEFQILQVLMENPLKVISRSDFVSRVWNGDPNVDERTIDVHITRLRKILLDNGKDGAEIIKTIRSRGYTLNNDANFRSKQQDTL